MWYVVTSSESSTVQRCVTTAQEWSAPERKWATMRPITSLCDGVLQCQHQFDMHASDKMCIMSTFGSRATYELEQDAPGKSLGIQVWCIFEMEKVIGNCGEAVTPTEKLVS